ncbi:MAG: sulfur carrier protein ThiS [bacterium]|nr:sulfur carrier protein ThiS [bacterium]
MKSITVNGKELSFEGETVNDIIGHYNLKPDSVVIEQNGEILHREQYNEAPVSEGDIIEIVKFVGGG